MDKRHKELLVFVVAIVVLALMVVMTLGKVRGKRPTPRPEATKSTVEVAQRADASHPDAAGDAVAADQEDEGPLLPYQGNIAVVPRHRDPFVPTINVSLTKGAPPPRSSRSGVPPVPRRIPDPFPFAASSLFGGPFGGPIKVVDPNGGPPKVSPQPAAEPLVLTGIVAGCPSVAIFRRADKRFFVKPGDQFADCQVVDISAQRVALVREGKHHSVFLGGKL